MGHLVSQIVKAEALAGLEQPCLRFGGLVQRSSEVDYIAAHTLLYPNHDSCQTKAYSTCLEHITAVTSYPPGEQQYRSSRNLVHNY